MYCRPTLVSMVQGICGCPRDQLCFNCFEQNLTWLGGVAASRGYSWADSVAERRPDLLTHPWPALEGRCAELAAVKVVDLAEDRRLFEQLLGKLDAAARRRWERLRGSARP